MRVGGLVTDTWVVSEGGCASAASGDLRSGAPHTVPITSDPVWPDVVRARDSRYEAGALPFQT